MITREDYLEHGLERIEFDSNRAFTREAAPGQSGLTSLTQNDAYDYDAECEASAAAIRAIVAPTITLEDMPQASTDRHRESMLRNMAKGLSEDDLAEVSQRALALELRDPLLYWQKAFDDCVPILHKQVHQLNERLDPEDAEWPIMQLALSADFINERVESPTYLRGSKDMIDAFSAAALDATADYTPRERKTLLGHLIMHSRVSARAERDFEKASELLPQEARPIAALVQEGGLEADIMARADYLASLPKDAFAAAMRKEQLECMTAIHESADRLAEDNGDGLAGALMQDRVRLRACAKMVEQSGAAAPDSADFSEIHRRTNAALLREFPLGSGHQVTVLSAEIARARVEAREAALGKLWSASRRNEPQK